MKNPIYPPLLQSGDRIALVTPSGVANPQTIAIAAEKIRSWGYQPVITEKACSVYGRYCGTIDERVGDLMMQFEDPSIRAILSTRGGYGIVQLLEHLNPEIILDNPKWVIGYSDITALHAYLNSIGVASIHAPMTKHIAEVTSEEESITHLRNFLKEGKLTYTTEPHPYNRGGFAEGTLIGGNLSVLQGVRGTPYDPTAWAHDPILFIEDIAEVPYKVDRMIYNLKLGGVFDRLKGLIVGQFTEYKEDPSMGYSLCEGIRQLVEAYDFPILFDFPVGHVARNFPLICGGKATLCVDENKKGAVRQ